MKTITPTIAARLVAALLFAAPLTFLGATDVPTEALTTEARIMKALNLSHYEAPFYPEGLRLEGVIEGTATLAVSRTMAGEPVDVLVLAASHPKFADAAVAAIREWRFNPAASAAEIASPRAIRMGFKLEGIVVVFPLNKPGHIESPFEVQPEPLLAPVEVPQLQAMRQPPKVLAQPMPAYPTALTKQKLQGTAAVRFFIDENGKVRLPQVVEATTPEFGDAALAAVTQWRYEPPQDGGRPVVVADNWAFQFKANN
jgi:TonB family protein